MQKAPASTGAFFDRQLPTLPGRRQPSTIGLCVLNYCVRNGNRWNHAGIVTECVRKHSCSLKTIQKKVTEHLSPSRITYYLSGQRLFFRRLPYKSSPRPISTGPLHPLQGFHSQPIYLVVFEGPYCFHMRNFISGWVSRLDAFSVYPFRTQLPGSTAGAITGTPSVRPLRSSRTKSRSLHVSCARDGYGPNCLTTF